jgi:hypothetical protein
LRIIERRKIMSLINGLLQRISGQSQKYRARRRTAFCPFGIQAAQVESLENRRLLSALTVTTAADSGAGSLRAEIAAAKSGDSINFASSLKGRTITLTSGELLINKGLTIQGLGAAQLTISGGNASRVFDVTSSQPVVLSGLTISNGNGVVNKNQSHNGDGEGGAILNDTTLTIRGCTVSGNSASYGGGAVANLGSGLSITSSTISGNTAGQYGGGIWGNGADLTISGSTLSSNTSHYGGAIDMPGGTLMISTSMFSKNTASNWGGAIYAYVSFPSTISGTSFTGNTCPYDGGAIFHDGPELLTLTGCTLSGNFAGVGGGIFNSGTLTVGGSTLSDNSATGYSGQVGNGGGIYNSGAITVRRSLFTGNSGDLGGGVCNNGFGATLSLASSTFTRNTASDSGGGTYNLGTLALTNCTLSLNSAGHGGGICVNTGGTLNLINTIVAGNTASANGPDISGAVATADHNLVGNAAGSTGIVNAVNGNIVGGNGLPVINALLGPLQNNGGPTQTMALLAGSPAIGHADNGLAPATDQRGVTRLDEPGELTDIGAFEL